MVLFLTILAPTLILLSLGLSILNIVFGFNSKRAYLEILLIVVAAFIAFFLGFYITTVILIASIVFSIADYKFYKRKNN